MDSLLLVCLPWQVGIPADREQYIHRLGRTGRKGKEGKGILMLAPWEDFFLSSVKDLPITKAPLPLIDPDTRKKVHSFLLSRSLLCCKPLFFDIVLHATSRTDLQADIWINILFTRKSLANKSQNFETDYLYWTYDWELMCIHPLALTMCWISLRCFIWSFFWIIQVERALAHVQMKNKESAYQAWLGYYNSNKSIGRDKHHLVTLANEFSSSMGLDTPPAIPKLVLRKMGLNNVPGLRTK